MTTSVLPSAKKDKASYPAAFPDELPYRIIKLFSNKGECVLDPFLGSGTTTKVAMQLERNSFGFDLHKELRPIIEEKLRDVPEGLRGQAEVMFVERNRVSYYTST